MSWTPMVIVLFVYVWVCLLMDASVASIYSLYVTKAISFRRLDKKS